VSDDGSIYVVYDGDCPFCSHYVKMIRLREALGKVSLVNAREEDHAIVKLVRERGVILDQEMALVMNGRIYSGPDCINRLALMSTKSTWFNKLNATIFSSPRFAAFTYPVLRAGRGLALKLLGRQMMGR